MINIQVTSLLINSVLSSIYQTIISYLSIVKYWSSFITAGRKVNMIMTNNIYISAGLIHPSHSP